MSITVKNFGDYSVKNVKSFVGMDGYGFNANLYRGKKKVAFLIDEGCGGEVNIEWLDDKLPRLEKDYPSKEAYEKAWADYKTARKEEQELLDAHVKSLPKVQSDLGSKPMELTIDAGWFVTDCVSKWELERDVRKMKKQCQSKTLFKTADHGYGQYAIIKAPCDEKIREHLRTKYGNDVEIFNDVIEKGEVPSVLKG
jgi:hypothetical protein